MTTRSDSPEKQLADIPWPLTFDSFSFDVRCYNTLASNIIFHGQQLGLSKEIDGPSGQPRSPDWKNRWTAGFIIPKDRMPPEPVTIRWTSLDGEQHYAEIDLIKGIFPEQVVLHNVPREDVNEDWARFEGGRTSSPDILMEVNDRTISVYMRAHVLTKSFPIPGREDVRSRRDLVLAWTQTY